MPEGDDFLMRPVLRGLIRYESLTDGTLDLCDIARLNDAIDIQDENSRRIAAAQEGGR